MSRTGAISSRSREDRMNIVTAELQNGAASASSIALALHWTPCVVKDLLAELENRQRVVLIGITEKGAGGENRNGRIYALTEMADAEKLRLGFAQRSKAGSGVIAGPRLIRGFKYPGKGGYSGYGFA